MTAGAVLPETPPARPHTTLWCDEAGERFYLIPDGAEKRAGSLVLRSGATRVLHADSAAMAAYEVSREEGLALLNARVHAFAGEVQSWVNRVAPLPAQAAAPPSGEDAREHGPGVNFVASVTGQTEEQLTASPEALLRGLGKLFESAAEAVAEARSGQEGREAVLARLRALGAPST
jgi:hypothetical protein